MAEPFKLVDTYLKQKTIPFDFENPPMDPKELYDRMAATMIKNKGLGLSCNQVGLQYSMFVFGNYDEPESIVGAFNPKIVDFSSGLEYGEEGCLSFPDLILRIKRPKSIVVRYQNEKQEWVSNQLDGYHARGFLHELDHLNGILFIDHISKLKREIILKKAIKEYAKN